MIKKTLGIVVLFWNDFEKQLNVLNQFTIKKIFTTH